MTDFAASPNKEFSLNAADYRSICSRIYDLAGIKLGDQKHDLVYGRLTKRLRALGLTDFSSYLKLLDSPEGQPEVEAMLNALTTNLTSFFREAHHFDHLKDIAIQASLDLRKPDRSLRIWSSASSTGEEPYSIAMTLVESGIDMSGIDSRILATDINTDVLRQASQGVYSKTLISKCPIQYKKYFKSSRAATGEVRDSIKNIISFRQLNLLGEWPIKKQFDVIFCRNVLIYFDNSTKAQLVDRFVNVLRPRGWLYLGHSESASGCHPNLEPAGRTIYRKVS